MKSPMIAHAEELLATHGYRVVPRRTALLVFLQSQKKPLTVTEIWETMPEKMDKVTLYRALEGFTASKIVAKVDLHSKASHYEFVHHDHHHHHIVCEKCGRIEDIEDCHQTELQKEVLLSSRVFGSITSHSLEFFGLCKKCM